MFFKDSNIPNDWDTGKFRMKQFRFVKLVAVK